jgi:hypothetical protein
MLTVCSHEATAYFTSASAADGTKEVEIAACEIQTFRRVVDSLPAIPPQPVTSPTGSLGPGVISYHEDAFAKQPRPSATSGLP